LEVVPGFEPGWTALQAAAWPLGYTTIDKTEKLLKLKLSLIWSL
jgi:hypothetical protein